MTIYADILFLINMVFDLEMLLIMLRLCSKKIHIFRLLLSACLGGMQGVFLFIPYFRVLCISPMRFLYPLLTVFIAAKPRGAREAAEEYLVFMGISFLFSGAITFFKIGAYKGLLLILPIYLLICLAKRKLVLKKCNVKLFYKGRSTETEGFYDSGNMLFYNGMPVMLASANVFKKVTGVKDLSESCENICDLKVIPYKTLGKTGAVFGITLDKAVVGSKEYENVILARTTDNFQDELILNGNML